MNAASSVREPDEGPWRWRVVAVAGIAFMGCLTLFSTRQPDMRSVQKVPPARDAPAQRKLPPEPPFEVPHQRLRITGADCGALNAGAGAELPATTALQVVSEGQPDTPFELDFLITYVNPFALQKNPREGAPSAQRIRDWNELYWCLWSIFRFGQLCLSPERCLLRTIHIFVNAADHVPAWLSCRLEKTAATDDEAAFQNFLATKVRVTSHGDIFPIAGLNYSITFNSNVIELMMHRIPGLSPFFLYFNNDMFLNRVLRLQDIFTPVAAESESDVPTCELVPTTFFKSRITHSAKGIQADVEEADDPDPTSSRRKSKMFYYFKRFNTNLLFKLSTTEIGGMIDARRGVRGWLAEEPRSLSVLQYAHTPTLFDMKTLAWLLNHPLISPSVNSTLHMWKTRSVDDVWVPFLYINVRYLSRRCYPPARCPFVNAVRSAPLIPRCYKFFEFRSEKTIVRAIRQESGSRRPLFVTLNDDFSDDVSATAADPSEILFEESKGLQPARCPKPVGCGGTMPRLAKDKKRSKASQLPIEVDGEKAFVDDGKVDSTAQAVRYLLLIHQFYCVALQRNTSTAGVPHHGSNDVGDGPAGSSQHTVSFPPPSAPLS